ncbi:MAG TPA: serine hydrolase, partial [Actinomycetospora sp.]|nr:serine hydrolase [Actinomycetospora sp.]
GVPRGLGAALVGAVVAGTLVTVDTVAGPSGILATGVPDLSPLDDTETVAAPTAPEVLPVDLAAVVSAAEDAAGDDVDVGVAVADVATGELSPGSAGDERFDTASLAKLLIVVDMLQRQRDGEVTLGARDLRLVHAALSASSDPAMNALWTQYDGPNAITRVATALGLEDTSSPEDPSQWGEVQSSARDMVTVLRHVQVDLPAPDRDLVLGAMGQAPPIARDGFDQGFGFLDGSGSPVKQGWMCCIGSRAEVHSIGVVDGRWVVAVMTSQPPGYDRARQVVDSAAGAVRERLGAPPPAG